MIIVTVSGVKKKQKKGSYSKSFQNVQKTLLNKCILIKPNKIPIKGI